MRALLAVVLVAVASAPAAAGGALGLTRPAAPEPKVIDEPTPSPLYYRLAPDVVEVLLRNGLGVAFRHRADEGDTDAAFALDLLGGVAFQFGRGSPYGLWLEGGYSYTRFHDHLLVLGVGPSLRSRDALSELGVALVVHAMIGSVDGERAVGLRTSAIGRAMIPLEIAHQVLVVGGRHIHELHVMLTVPFVGGT